MNKQGKILLTYEGQQIELPVYASALGPAVIDIRTLAQQLGLFTYDPGFLATASCQSAITFIDGDAGL